MAVLVAVAKWMLESFEMTEAQAYAQYAGHVAHCPHCQPTRGRTCKKGVELHAQWKRTEAQQASAVR